ncbi:MAG: hypothetical protein ABR861_07210 [Terriglobales bacterium]
MFATAGVLEKDQPETLEPGIVRLVIVDILDLCHGSECTFSETPFFALGSNRAEYEHCALILNGRFWHKAPQAANRRKEMTRICAIRFTMTRPRKAASDFWAPRRFRWKHTSTFALHGPFV